MELKNNILIIELLYKNLSNKPNNETIKKRLVILSKIVAQKVLFWESNNEMMQLHQMTCRWLSQMTEFPKKLKDRISMNHHYEKKQSLPQIWRESVRVHLVISHILLEETPPELSILPKDPMTDLCTLFCEQIEQLERPISYNSLKMAYQTLIIIKSGVLVEIEELAFCFQLFDATGVYSLIQDKIINFQPIIRHFWKKESTKALATKIYFILKNITLPHALAAPIKLVELYQELDPEIIETIVSDKTLMQMFGNGFAQQMILNQSDNSDEIVLQFLPKIINNNNKNALLTLACELNNVTALKILLEKNCSINYKNIMGNTPMICAINGHDEEKLLEIMHLLIKNDADVSIPNHERITPLHALILPSYAFNTHPSIDKAILMSAIEILMSAGADINAQCQHGNTILHLWCEYADPSLDHFDEIIDFLIEKGANPNLENEDMETPFSILNMQ